MDVDLTDRKSDLANMQWKLNNVQVKSHRHESVNLVVISIDKL